MAVNAYDQLNYAQYKPLSMQEIWAPAQEMRKQHDQLQEEYSQQEQQGSLSLLGIDKNLDKNAYDIQQNFINKTKEAADLLATKGVIDSGRRRQLSELKSMYAQQVVPLQNALTQRSQRAEEYRKLGMDKTNILGVNPNNIALTDIVGNPKSLDYKFLSGTQMAKDVANEAKQFADRFDNKDIKDYGAKVGFNHLLAIRQGVDPTTVLAAMKNDPKVMGTEGGKKVYEQLVGIVNSVTDRYGLKDIATTPEEYKRGWRIASSGLSEAIGKVTPMQMHDDRGAFNYEQSLKQTPPNPIILGNDMNTRVFDEGTAGEIVNKLLNIKTGKPGISNLFNNDMPGFKNGKLTQASPTISGGDVISFSSDGFKQRMGVNQKNYNDVKNALDIYRTERKIKSNVSDEAVYNQLIGDKNAKIILQTAKQHEYTPIVDVQTGKQILSTIMSNIPSAEFVDYSTNYKGDSETGTDYTTMAKRSGFSSGQQLLDYMDKHPELISKNNTDGRFMMQVPTNINGVDKQGNITFKGGSPEYKHIGFAATNSHKMSVNAINKLRSRESSGKEDTVEISSRQVQNNGNIYTIKSFHDGKTGRIIEQLYDNTGKKVKTQETNASSFINDENQNIYHGEILNAYQIAHQKDNKSE